MNNKHTVMTDSMPGFNSYSFDTPGLVDSLLAATENLKDERDEARRIAREYKRQLEVGRSYSQMYARLLDEEKAKYNALVADIQALVGIVG